MLLIQVFLVNIYADNGDFMSVYGKVKVVGIYGENLLIRLIDNNGVDIPNSCHEPGEYGNNTWVYIKSSASDSDKFNALLSLAMYAQATKYTIRLRYISGQCINKQQIIKFFTVFE